MAGAALLLLSAGAGLWLTPWVRRGEAVPDRGWDDEALPAGMHRGKERPLYVFDTGKGVEIEMVRVPAGPFTMGAGESIVFRSPYSSKGADQKPCHSHPMPQGYYIGRNDVTWKQYLAFCDATGRAKPAAPSWGIQDDHPVVNVSWDDARAFSDWASLSLPTEAQWEKAARGTDGRTYPWGNEWDPARSNFCDRSCSMGYPWTDKSADDGFAYTSPVGSYPAGASPYGALDMSGNVRQWCDDWYDENAYARYARGETTPPSSGRDRLARGGSWGDPAEAARSTDRHEGPPSSRSDDIGFRPVR